MKTKIDYYLIPEAQERAKLYFACRIAEKAFMQKYKVYLHVSSQEQADLLNDLLWTFKDISFLPHNIVGAGDASIQIGFSEPPADDTDVLINLTETVPEFFAKFVRVIEIVGQNPTMQEKARANYRYYKDQGLSINTNDLRKSK